MSRHPYVAPNFARTKQLVFDSLPFNKNIEVQSFKITVRLLGGLLTAYQMDGDKRFITLAEDLGKRLLPVFNTPTGMPYRFVHLQSGKIRDSLNNPAKIGTALIEFGTMSKLTGNPIYYHKAKGALVALYTQRSKVGLVGELINVKTGEWVNKISHIGGGIDSYYKYLLKSLRFFQDQDCRNMADESMKAVDLYIADTMHGTLSRGKSIVAAIGDSPRANSLLKRKTNCLNYIR